MYIYNFCYSNEYLYNIKVHLLPTPAYFGMLLKISVNFRVFIFSLFRAVPTGFSFFHIFFLSCVSVFFKGISPKCLSFLPTRLGRKNIYLASNYGYYLLLILHSINELVIC